MRHAYNSREPEAEDRIAQHRFYDGERHDNAEQQSQEQRLSSNCGRANDNWCNSDCHRFATSVALRLLTVAYGIGSQRNSAALALGQRNDVII